mmetsp:Transcript_12027/g.38304  ORF Transcript_12027/g.38304 Transcript_12027/m.38304 type:complete len:272 (-) Transcript_12027:31-846(-)
MSLSTIWPTRSTRDETTTSVSSVSLTMRATSTILLTRTLTASPNGSISTPTSRTLLSTHTETCARSESMRWWKAFVLRDAGASSTLDVFCPAAIADSDAACCLTSARAGDIWTEPSASEVRFSTDGRDIDDVRLSSDGREPVGRSKQTVFPARALRGTSTVTRLPSTGLVTCSFDPGLLFLGTVNEMVDRSSWPRLDDWCWTVGADGCRVACVGLVGTGTRTSTVRPGLAFFGSVTEIEDPSAWGRDTLSPGLQPLGTVNLTVVVAIVLMI